MAPKQRKNKTGIKQVDTQTLEDKKTTNESTKTKSIKSVSKRKTKSSGTNRVRLLIAGLLFVVGVTSVMFLAYRDAYGASTTGTYEFERVPFPEFNISRGIDRRSNLSLDEFIDLYDAKWPVLVTDAMKSWPSTKKWNKQFFMSNYGNEVISFKGISGKLHNRQGLATPLGVFLQHIGESSPTQWSYLEDEVFLFRNPKLLNDIDTPIYLREDFFSLLPEEIRPWNSMLLWGTKYSRSTLHIDPYNWTGTNAVIQGRKQWKLYPPGQDHLLYVPSGRKSGFPLDCPKYQSSVDAFDYDEIKYPKFKHAQAIEFVQMPGEMLFIPTGWFHQAYNREETMAISSQVWNSQNLKQVMEEIVKGGNVRRKDIPADLDSLSPRSQVEAVISLFPHEILEHGKKVNKNIMDQLDTVARRAQSSP